MTIRRALSADAEAVGRIYVESWNVAYRGIMPDDIIAKTDLAYRTRFWAERIEVLEVRYRIRFDRVLKDRLGKDTRP